MMSELTVDYTISFLYFSQNADRRNAVTIFFGKQVAYDKENFTTI